LSIVKKSWDLSEFSVATWNLKIKNSSPHHAYKDLHFKTTYWARSGTKVDESLLGHTEYIDIPPGRTVDIEFTEFTHSQAHRAVIEIASAAAVGGETLEQKSDPAHGTYLAKIKLTSTHIKKLKVALNSFYRDVGRYPTAWEGLEALRTRPAELQRWKGPYVTALPSDPWGHAYVYTPKEGSDFMIESYGADGQPGGSNENADILGNG